MTKQYLTAVMTTCKFLLLANEVQMLQASPGCQTHVDDNFILHWKWLDRLVHPPKTTAQVLALKVDAETDTWIQSTYENYSKNILLKSK